ncbi:MAG: Uma2 family endonuclease [Pseudanabaenaceae cyanobacterium SKYGB_i_bin29]|nr:Uma2 family endonuclease [Pseudanabaenaceae cyanobacterium SKYG29]MDW8420495.1 Uma2 family endonuclease [Pseudanabaenaceae cyanobacterium SKYGB_i_bin29]
MTTSKLSSPNHDLRPWVSADLELLPQDSSRYEIVEGELFVTRAPHWQHQTTCGNFYTKLKLWSERTNLGYVCLNPGVIFSEQNDVIPDVVWVSKQKFQSLIDEAGHLRGAPDLVIEVLSPGAENVRRDRQVKLKLYSVYGVLEYWLADWQSRQIEVYRREGGVLKLAMTLYNNDLLTSPLLPNFTCAVQEIFD